MKFSRSASQIRQLAKIRDERQIGRAERFQDETLIAAFSKARSRGYFTLEELKVAARWKWSGGRTERLCNKNNENFVCEVSKFAMADVSERFRVESLQLLSGVSWPMASVLLHFVFPRRYPILDRYALTAADLIPNKNANPKYDFELWWRYTKFCRNLSSESGISLRELDKALWQFGYET